MSAFTVKELVTTKEWEGQHGPMVTYTLEVTDPAGQSQRVQMNRKPTSAAPSVGQILNGTLDARTDRACELSDDPVLAWPQETT